MLREIGTLGIGIIVKGKQKVGKRVDRLSRVARHPRTELVDLARRLMQAGESELNNVEAAFRDLFDEKQVPPWGALESYCELEPADAAPTLDIGDVCQFTDLKTNKLAVGRVEARHLRPLRHFYLVKDFRTRKYFICCAHQDGFIGINDP